MKKLVSLLLGLMMVFMISTAMAETVVVKPGETLEMKVSLSSASGKGAEVGIKTNDAPVTFVSAVGGDVNDTVPPKAFNDFFVVVNIEGVSIKPDGTGLSGNLNDYTLSDLTDGVIGTLTFQVDADAEEGTYTVEAYKKSGSCTVTGSVTFEVKGASRLPGDANNDGKVNARDALLIAKYAAGWQDLVINLENAEVNADGRVNARDALAIAKYAAGWEDVVLK